MRVADWALLQCPQGNRHRGSPRLAFCYGANVQAQPQKKVARVSRIDGSILLYRLAARRQFKAERSTAGTEPWWGIFLGVPLFLRTLLRLVIACSHQHKGPPITPSEPVPANLQSRPDNIRGSYITCLDCGQKFAYDHKTRRMVDFWGVHDTEARARVRRKIAEFFSPLRGFAIRAARINRRIPLSEVVRPMQRLGISTKGH